MEERFGIGRTGASNTSALFVDDTRVRIDHRLLKTPLVVPLADVRSVARMHTVRDGTLLLAHDVRDLSLTPSGLDDNVLLLFSGAVPCGPFKYGAENGLSISRKQRKRGLEVEAVGLAVEDADALAASLRRHGVRTYDDADAMLRREVGEPAVYELPERLAQRRRALRISAAKSLGFGTVVSMALAARIGVSARSTARSITALLVVAAVSGLVAGFLFARWVARQKGRPVEDRPRGSVNWKQLALFACTVVPFGLGFLAYRAGVSGVIAFGIPSGVPGGFLTGFGIDQVRQARALSADARLT